MQYPEKPASVDYPVLPAIKKRWSPVAMSDQQIEEEKIATIFEAARWAPSSYNEQPWRYVYATKEDSNREQIESLILAGNSWAKNAYLLIVSFTKKTFAKNGKENAFALHDLGAANGYIALQAAALGLVDHQMAGFKSADANALLGVPGEYLPGSMIAIGYPGDPANLPEDLQKRQAGERARKEQSTFAFRNAWAGEAVSS